METLYMLPWTDAAREVIGWAASSPDPRLGQLAEDYLLGRAAPPRSGGVDAENCVLDFTIPRRGSAVLDVFQLGRPLRRSNGAALPYRHLLCMEHQAAPGETGTITLGLILPHAGGLLFRLYLDPARRSERSYLFAWWPSNWRQQTGSHQLFLSSPRRTPRTDVFLDAHGSLHPLAGGLHRRPVGAARYRTRERGSAWQPLCNLVLSRDALAPNARMLLSLSLHPLAGLWQEVTEALMASPAEFCGLLPDPGQPAPAEPKPAQDYLMLGPRRLRLKSGF